MQTRPLLMYLLVLGVSVAAACSDNGDSGLEPPRLPRFDSYVDSTQCAEFGGCREPTFEEWMDAFAALNDIKPEGECGTLKGAMESALTRGAYKIIQAAPNPGTVGAWGPVDRWFYIREDFASRGPNHTGVFAHEAAHDLGYGLNQETVDWLNYYSSGYYVQEDSRASEVAGSCIK